METVQEKWYVNHEKLFFLYDINQCYLMQNAFAVTILNLGRFSRKSPENQKLFSQS